MADKRKLPAVSSRKGGHNPEPSLVTERPAPPIAMTAPDICPLCQQPIQAGDACYTAHKLGHVHWECHEKERDKAAADWQGNLMIVGRFIRAHYGAGQAAQEALRALCNVITVDEAAFKLRLGWPDKATPHDPYPRRHRQ